MRFSVGYKVNKLDLSYRMQIYSLIKEAIRCSSKEYYEKLFVQLDREMKEFTYSTYIKNLNIKGTEIYLDEITISISSPSMEFAVHCFNGIRNLKEYRVGKEVWKQSHIKLLNEHSISSRKVVFKTLSPILIEDRNGKPLGPNDENYEAELNYYANLKIQRFAGRSLFEPLVFTPINYSKMVIKEKNRHMESDSILYFTAYKCIFTLEGNPQDLQLIYQLGLGKRSVYFGMLNYIGEEV